ncbi:MAG: short-chain dehydrogenase [Proteobacteria bacterium]|nr:MAG: short-chain dehydrogenase [Pseudomonadota bacterium]
MPARRSWSAADVPDQSGRVAIVTGANSGLGFATASVLASRGAHVILACRDTDRGKGALDAITAAHPSAGVELQPLDLASLASVRAFAAAFAAQHERLDLLCNNAGVMALPPRRTADGFEMQLGTNHLGHFALTGLLLDRLLAAPAARVVTVSSTLHRPGRIHWDDLHLERSYRKWIAYAQSKLANLLFAHELDRRLRASGARAISAAAHPGYAATNLQTAGPRMAGARLFERLSLLGNRVFAQTADAGALPTLYAATAPDVQGGDYIGPGGFGEMRGAPRKVGCTARARNAADAARLWQLSESLTGVRFDALAGPDQAR